MVTASAGGVYPMPLAPVYSAAKAGAVMVVRSLAERLIKKYGIRITALCPQVHTCIRCCLGRGGGLTGGWEKAGADKHHAR
jgi:NAD(P)-dependent dehydrogenase (short-subunit alcohol dehydrogenase family)